MACLITGASRGSSFFKRNHWNILSGWIKPGKLLKIPQMRVPLVLTTSLFASKVESTAVGKYLHCKGHVWIYVFCFALALYRGLGFSFITWRVSLEVRYCISSHLTCMFLCLVLLLVLLFVRQEFKNSTTTDLTKFWIWYFSSILSKVSVIQL